jgi:hypothetical protein
MAGMAGIGGGPGMAGGLGIAGGPGIAGGLGTAGALGTPGVPGTTDVTVVVAAGASDEVDDVVVVVVVVVSLWASSPHATAPAPMVMAASATTTAGRTFQCVISALASDSVVVKALPTRQGIARRSPAPNRRCRNTVSRMATRPSTGYARLTGSGQIDTCQPHDEERKHAHQTQNVITEDRPREA